MASLIAALYWTACLAMLWVSAAMLALGIAYLLRALLRELSGWLWRRVG